MAATVLWSRYKHILFYGALLAILLLLLKWLEIKFIIIDYSFEIFIGAVALIFTALGIWLALKLTNRDIRTVVIEKEILVGRPKEFYFDNNALSSFGLSNRELEVLQLMASGLSNQQIAERLFVSLNTIKTHSSRVFEKMDVERRTQAIDKARKMGLVP